MSTVPVSHRKRLAIAGLLLFILVSIGVQFFDSSGAASERKNASFFVLNSLEANDLPSMVTDIATGSEGGNGTLYLLRESTNSISILSRDRKAEKVKAAFPVAKIFTVDAQGRIFSVGNSLLSVRDDKANPILDIAVPANTASVSALRDGSVVIAGGDSESLLKIFDKSGRLIRRIGNQKRLDARDIIQNRFLNTGKVTTNQSNEIFFTSLHSPFPTVQKFSEHGVLLKEFSIEGASIELQLKRANEFLRQRKPSCIGGYFIIRDITTDPITGHLWIGMNGLSEDGAIRRESGVLYEYSPEGEKLGEYSLTDSRQATSVTDIKEIAVNFPHLYTLTSGGRVYAFDLASRSNFEPKAVETKGMSFTFITRAVVSALSPTVSAQGSCPTAQSYSCSGTCPSGSTPQSVDCGAELVSRLNQGEVVISGSCQTGTSVGQNGGCSGTITGCAGNNVRVTYSTTLQCNAAPTPTPTPTPEPTPTPGGGGGGCSVEDELSCYDQSPWNTWDSNDCRCVWHPGECGGGENCTPVVIDIDGDGFDLTNAAGGMPFDLNSDGTVQSRLAWTSANSDDSWLALDRNNNGLIENGSELFGNFTSQPVPPSGEGRNGFLALAVFDRSGDGGNNDGRISSEDAVFSRLRLWQDLNHNGISEANELSPLLALGVATIELDYRESRRRDQHGNLFKYRAKVRDIHGAQVGRWAWDVFLVSEPFNSQAVVFLEEHRAFRLSSSSCKADF